MEPPSFAFLIEKPFDGEDGLEPPSFAFLIEKPFDGEDGLEPPAFRYESRSTARTAWSRPLFDMKAARRRGEFEAVRFSI